MPLGRLARVQCASTKWRCEGHEVRTKHKVAVLAEQRLARDHADARHDARALAIELARGEPSARFDPMTAGVVLKPREIPYRQLPVWIRVQQDGQWAGPSSADVVVTDQRLLCRFASGQLCSLWWSGVVGLCVNLAEEHVVLDYGDGQPVDVSGPWVASVAVVGVAATYGIWALVDHSALARLRS